MRLRYTSIYTTRVMMVVSNTPNNEDGQTVPLLVQQKFTKQTHLAIPLLVLSNMRNS